MIIAAINLTYKYSKILMQKAGNIFLIGPMASGKSTIGRRLAAKTNRQFFDSDREIESRTGADIALIFEIEGEAGFRQREARMIAELAGLKNIVLATGGGVVLSAENKEHLQGKGLVIYLRSSVETILARTVRDKKRPLLQTDRRREKIQNMLVQRAEIYEALADHVFDTDNNSVRRMVKMICQKLAL